MANLPRSIAELDKGRYIIMCTGGYHLYTNIIQEGAQKAVFCVLPRGYTGAPEKTCCFLQGK